MTQQQGGKRLASREKRRVRRGNPLILPFILGVIVLVLLGVKLALPHFRSSAPTPPDWVTQELLEVNPFSRPSTKLEEVNGIAVHYVGNPGTTAEQNRSFFAGLAQQEPAAEGEPDPNTYASSHFLIGLDGEIIQCHSPWTSGPTVPASATRTLFPSNAATRMRRAPLPRLPTRVS